MRVGGGPVIVASVELDVHIEFAPDSSSIQGAVVAAAGTRIEFSGWLGLAAVLGTLLDEAGSGPDDPWATSHEI